MPSYVEDILDRLEGNGYKAYVVGGAVRDMVMGNMPKDYDITTDCLPEKVEELFSDKKTILVGKRFGTINIVNEGEHVEVTTFRTEGRYTDGRRPEELEFSTELREDLKRRDFTINSLAYNYKEGIIDLFNGLGDINDGKIRTVGNPLFRFEEDYLRILRGVRFSSRFNFEIEENTLLAMKKLSNNLNLISQERIRDEFFKMLLLDRPSNSIRILEKIGGLDLLFPEISALVGFDQKNPNHTMDVYEHSLCVLDNTDSKLELRLAALYHDVGKFKTFTVDEQGIGHFYGHNEVSVDISRKRLKKLNSSNKLIDDVSNLIHYHMNSKDDIKKPGLKRLLRRFGDENIFNLFKLQIADTICSNNRREDIERIENRAKDILEILEKKETYDKGGLNINGSDLIKAGYKEGKEIGIILNYLLEEVLLDEEKNEQQSLLRIALNKFPI